MKHTYSFGKNSYTLRTISLFLLKLKNPQEMHNKFTQDIYSRAMYILVVLMGLYTVKDNFIHLYYAIFYCVQYIQINIFCLLIYRYSINNISQSVYDQIAIGWH